MKWISGMRIHYVMYFNQYKVVLVSDNFFKVLFPKLKKLSI